MSSQENDDVARMRRALGGDFDFSEVRETLSDASTDLSMDAKVPSLSALKTQRLGTQEPENPAVSFDASSTGGLFERFTADSQSKPAGSEATQEPVKNRVYLKTPKNQSDATEAFAAKSVVVSGTTGKITERGS